MQKIGNFFFPDEDTHFIEFEEHRGGVANYQKKQREYALGFVKDFRLCADVGAHVGLFSSHFAQHFDKVLAFEPMPDVRACLELNVPANVEIIPSAVSDISGEATLISPGGTNSGQGYLRESAEMPEGSHEAMAITVKVTTIDEMNLPYLGLIKLDVQGAEEAVLKGARQTLRRCKTVVLIEEKPIGGPDGSVEHIAALQKLLAGMGATKQKKVGADRVYTFE